MSQSVLNHVLLVCLRQVPLMRLIFSIEKKLRGLPSDMQPQTLLVTYAIPR